MAARHNEQVLHKPCVSFFSPFPSHHHEDHVIIHLDPGYAGDVLVLEFLFETCGVKVDTWLFVALVDYQSPRVETSRDPCKGVDCLWIDSKLQGNI